MSQQIFVFTAGNAAARSHLQDSIQSRIDLQTALDTFPSSDHQLLKDLDARHGLYAWGAVPGTQNTPRWKSMKSGDRVLCVFDNRYRFVARLLAKFDNEHFARRVWGSDPDGKTWQFIYFLDTPLALNIPVVQLSPYLDSGYRGFTRISDDKLSRIAADFGDVDTFIQQQLLDQATSASGQVYALIRSNDGSDWKDEPGRIYKFGSTVPNYSKLLDGANVVVDTNASGTVSLVGHGELSVATPRGAYSRESRQGTHYESEYLRWTPFAPPRPLDEQSLQQLRGQPNYNVQHAIRIIDESLYRRLTTAPPRTMTHTLHAVADEFAMALTRSHLRFGPNHDHLVRAFIASVVAKPFLILTGISGSGKSQLAIRFGEWLGTDRMLVSAVRPDWTGAEALFGFEDALRPPLNGSYPWHVPPILSFMLKAVSDAAHLYLLLLDEMNLSHVERYFADALSGMESGLSCLPNLSLEADGCWRRVPGGPPAIPFPRNLVVIGTVNVDETTYMFSPKVLDRAHTFEFRVTATELTSDIRKPSRCEPAHDTLTRSLLTAITDDGLHTRVPYSNTEELTLRLREVHELLAKHAFEFGHRVFYEAIRFAAIHEQCGDATLSTILDRILLQKVLPRLHGSRRRLEQLLLGLCSYCFALPPPTLGADEIARFDPDRHPVEEAALPQSFGKLQRMTRTLRANQFASFSE